VYFAIPVHQEDSYFNTTGLYLLIVMVTAFATAYTSLNELRLPGATSLAIVGVEIVALATTGHSL